MKRKQVAEETKRGNTKAKKNTSDRAGSLDFAVKIKRRDLNFERRGLIGMAVDESVDVQTFFVQDCDAAAKQLVDHAKRRCDELRREFSKSREAILNEIVAQKENLPAEEEEEEPRLACDIVVQCILGPYKGNSYILNMDLEEHPIALIGRSTGKKFRTPHGLSFPKDYEVSTTHGQLRLEPDGQLVFTDLDSTNGSYINDELIDPQQPTPLNPSAPCKLSVGGSELMLSIVKRQ